MIFPNFRSLDPGRDDDPKHKVTEYIGHEKQYIRNCDMHVWDEVRSYSPALSFRLLPSPTVQLIQLSRFQQWSLWNPTNKNLPHQQWNKAESQWNEWNDMKIAMNSSKLKDITTFHIGSFGPSFSQSKSDQHFAQKERPKRPGKLCFVWLDFSGDLYTMWWNFEHFICSPGNISEYMIHFDEHLIHMG